MPKHSREYRVGLHPNSRGSVSTKCFEELVKDGWEDTEQLVGLDQAWKNHILALAPNGGQRRNLERMFGRVEAGPLNEKVTGTEAAKVQEPGVAEQRPDESPATIKEAPSQVKPYLKQSPKKIKNK